MFTRDASLSMVRLVLQPLAVLPGVVNDLLQAGGALALALEGRGTDAASAGFCPSLPCTTWCVPPSLSHSMEAGLGCCVPVAAAPRCRALAVRAVRALTLMLSLRPVVAMHGAWRVWLPPSPTVAVRDAPVARVALSLSSLASLASFAWRSSPPMPRCSVVPVLLLPLPAVAVRDAPVARVALSLSSLASFASSFSAAAHR